MVFAVAALGHCTNRAPLSRGRKAFQWIAATILNRTTLPAPDRRAAMTM
jgi:hypothetical protein